MDVLRTPKEPYPGLRPFLDHEAPLLLGRGSQIKEITKRLRQSHFVAVVGGSGCGKSSIIRAGVVPRLRGLAIPEAGGYWVPVVCTPGTTRPAMNEPVEATQTPVTRLSWKFDQVLLKADGLNSSARREEIATVFRQGAGFARLVDAYHEALPPQGPSTSEARFIFVIDQFEELFHRDNAGSPDVEAMIDAVIAHFFNPHERCYIVLTMRSENLADCAAYLDLPDAINKALYLLKRLNDRELREVIIGPAKYYLRLRQRGDAEGLLKLPSDTVFEDAVVTRLLADARTIVHDPDHLPLLQHALARCWESACAREGVPDQGVPAVVQWGDLERAATADDNADGLADRINVLRDSLENWAQRTYQSRDEPARHEIDALLRRLAFKEPNNGLYFQQRVPVDDGTTPSKARLHELLDRGFRDSVNYLFWDDEDEKHQTLKVSHESFIRGWRHFRGLVDRDAERFEEFIAVLRRCEDWKADPKLLLGRSEIARIAAADLEPVLRDSAKQEQWFRVLSRSRDGDRYQRLRTALDDFIAKSRQHNEEEERDRKQTEQMLLEATHKVKLQRTQLFAVVALGFCVLLIAIGAGYTITVLSPVMDSVSRFSHAQIISQTYNRVESSTGPSDNLMNLNKLLTAADDVQKAKANGRFLYQRPASGFSWFPPVNQAKLLFELSSSEPIVNGNLRQLMTTHLWQRTVPDVVHLDGTRFEPRSEHVFCKIQPVHDEAPDRHGGSGLPGTGFEEVDAPHEPNGTLFLDSTSRDAGQPIRAVFVASQASATNEVVLRTALWNGKECKAGAPFWSAPLMFEPKMLIDARSRYLAMKAVYPDQLPSVTLYRINWIYGPDGLPSDARPQQLSTATDPATVIAFDDALSSRAREDSKGVDRLVGNVLTWRELGGHGFTAAGHAWRVFDDGAQPIEAPMEGAWDPLDEPAPESSLCGRLAAFLKPRTQPGFTSIIYTHRGDCIQIQTGIPPAAASRTVQSKPTGASAEGGASSAGPKGSVDSEADRQQVLIALYSSRDASRISPDGLEPLPTIASLRAFDRLPKGSYRWFFGSSGTQAGWIALEGDNAQKRGAPLTTEALAALARQLPGTTRP